MIFNTLKTGKIKILGNTIKISHEDMTGKDEIGVCDVCNNTIRIDSRVADEMKESTLIHEIIHYIDERLMLGMTETQVMGLESGIYSVIKDNTRKRKK